MPLIGTTLTSQPSSQFLAGERPYTGRILRVDLSSGRLWVDEPEERFYRQLVGGRNVILHYLLTAMPAKADPLGPENLLIFAPGLLTGTTLPGTGRHAVGGKSPLTGALGSGEAGGWWGAELKKAGFDAVVIQGRADSPVYLWIKDGQVEVRDASHLWGLPTAETQESIRAELADEKVRVAQIGPAGETLVRFASVMHDINRAAGRSGLGAVMGSKNLKAVAVRGSHPVAASNKELLAAVQKWINSSYKTEMGWAINAGTSGSVKYNIESGTTAIRNYTAGTFEQAADLDASGFFPTLLKDRDTCNRCPVRCKLVVEKTDAEPRVDPRYGGPEYESIGGLGALCGVGDAAVVAKANELCAAYGLDTISTGGTIAFAMDAAEKGLIPAEMNPPRFGDGEALLACIEQIAARSGLGEWMAEGSARMAQRLGSGAEELLAVARGQELPLHDPRLKQTLAMGYALSATGADHMHNYNDTFATFDKGDIAQRLREVGVETPMALWGITEHKIEAFYYETAFKNFYDCAVICHFYPYLYSHMADALGAAGGWKVDQDEINAIGARAVNLGRLFLLREGFTAADDTLSARAYHRLAEGPIAGKGLSPEELRQWLPLYYRRMGWDTEGVPGMEALQQLGLTGYVESF